MQSVEAMSEQILYWLSLNMEARALAERLRERFAVTVGALPASAARLHAAPGGLYGIRSKSRSKALEGFEGNMKMDRRSDGSVDSFRESDPHSAAQIAAPTGPSHSVRAFPTDTVLPKLIFPTLVPIHLEILKPSPESGTVAKDQGSWRNGMQTLVADQYSRGGRDAARNALTLFVTAPTGHCEAAQPQTRSGRTRLHLLSHSARPSAASSALEERGPETTQSGERETPSTTQQAVNDRVWFDIKRSQSSEDDIPLSLSAEREVESSNRDPLRMVVSKTAN